MERAILKTLQYGDIFDYPLKAYEIHKWLICRKTTFQQVQKSLKAFREYKGYYFLRGKNKVSKRIKNSDTSKKLLFKAKALSRVLKIIPWIKLVGVSGALSMENASKKDDIDLFIITDKNRVWLSRFFTNLLFLTLRRNRKSKSYGGKFCLNVFIDEDHLIQRKDLYTAHEVLQMKVLWDRDGVYSRFLEENSWAFKYLPNWSSGQYQRSKIKYQKYNSKFKTIDLAENIAKWIQLKYMGKPEGMERIQEGALYFHPKDCRQSVLDKVC